MSEDWRKLAKDLAKEFGSLSEVEYFLLKKGVSAGPAYRPTAPAEPERIKCYAMGKKMVRSDDASLNQKIMSRFIVSSEGDEGAIPVIRPEDRFEAGGIVYAIESVDVKQPGGVAYAYDITVSR